MKQPQVTIKDIARELSISPSTVSRALKDHPDISPETKKAVNDLAKKLNYYPNAVALSLRKSKTNTIGVIIPEIVHFFFSTVISGIEEIAYGAGYNVMVCQSNESFEREVTDTHALLASRVDGMIVSMSRETTDFEHLKEIQNRGVPLVLFDRMSDELNASSVVVDDEKGAYEATKHLIDQGFKRIAHIMGPPNLIISQRRKDGYLKALKEHGFKADESLILRETNASKNDAEKITREVLSGSNPPDAIFANNDLAAYGAMLVAQERGLKIPKEFGVVGFSDWQFSSFVKPTLTTVAQPGLEMGQEAARIFLSEVDLEDEPEPTEVILPTKLVIRESSKRK